MDGRIPILCANGLQPTPIAEVFAGPAEQIAAMQTALDRLSLRVAALEGRPEEVAHFSTSAKLPAIAALATISLTLKNLVPARAGDVLRAGERVSVAAAVALPDGITPLGAIVPSDGTVVLRLSASLAVAAGASAIPWSIAALR